MACSHGGCGPGGGARATWQLRPTCWTHAPERARDGVPTPGADAVGGETANSRPGLVCGWCAHEIRAGQSACTAGRCRAAAAKGAMWGMRRPINAPICKTHRVARAVCRCDAELWPALADETHALFDKAWNRWRERCRSNVGPPAELDLEPVLAADGTALPRSVGGAALATAGAAIEELWQPLRPDGDAGDSGESWVLPRGEAVPVYTGSGEKNRCRTEGAAAWRHAAIAQICSWLARPASAEFGVDVEAPHWRGFRPLRLSVLRSGANQRSKGRHFDKVSNLPLTRGGVHVGIGPRRTLQYDGEPATVVEAYVEDPAHPMNVAHSVVRASGSDGWGPVFTIRAAVHTRRKDMPEQGIVLPIADGLDDHGRRRFRAPAPEPAASASDSSSDGAPARWADWATESDESGAGGESDGPPARKARTRRGTRSRAAQAERRQTDRVVRLAPPSKRKPHRPVPPPLLSALGEPVGAPFVAGALPSLPECRPSHGGPGYTALPGREVSLGFGAVGVAVGAGLMVPPRWVISRERRPRPAWDLAWPAGATLTVSPDGVRLYCSVSWPAGTCIVRPPGSEGDTAIVHGTEISLGKARHASRLQAGFTGRAGGTIREQVMTAYAAACTTTVPWSYPEGYDSGRSEILVSAVAFAHFAGMLLTSGEREAACVLAGGCPGPVRALACAILAGRGVLEPDDFLGALVHPEDLPPLHPRSPSTTAEAVADDLRRIGFVVKVRRDEVARTAFRCPVGQMLTGESEPSAVLQIAPAVQLHALGGKGGALKLRAHCQGVWLPDSDGRADAEALIPLQEEDDADGAPVSSRLVLAALFSGATSWTAGFGRHAELGAGLLCPAEVWAADCLLNGKTGVILAEESWPGARPAGGGRTRRQPAAPEPPKASPADHAPPDQRHDGAEVRAELSALLADPPTPEEFAAVRLERKAKNAGEPRWDRQCCAADAVEAAHAPFSEAPPAQVRSHTMIPTSAASALSRGEKGGEPVAGHIIAASVLKGLGRCSARQEIHRAGVSEWDPGTTVAPFRGEGRFDVVRWGTLGGDLGWMPPAQNGPPSRATVSPAETRGALTAGPETPASFARGPEPYLAWAVRCVVDPIGQDLRVLMHEEVEEREDGEAWCRGLTVATSSESARVADLAPEQLEQVQRVVGTLVAADAAVREGRAGVAMAMLCMLPLPAWFGGNRRRKHAAASSHVAMLRGEEWRPRGGDGEETEEAPVVEGDELLDAQRWMARGLFAGHASLTPPPVRLARRDPVHHDGTPVDAETRALADEWLRLAAADSFMARTTGPRGTRVCWECGDELPVQRRGRWEPAAEPGDSPVARGAGPAAAPAGGWDAT